MIYLMNHKPDRALATLSQNPLRRTCPTKCATSGCCWKRARLSDTGRHDLGARSDRQYRGPRGDPAARPTFCGPPNAGAKPPSRSNCCTATAGATSGRSTRSSAPTSCARRSAMRSPRRRSGWTACARNMRPRWRTGPDRRAFEVVSAPTGTERRRIPEHCAREWRAWIRSIRSCAICRRAFRTATCRPTRQKRRRGADDQWRTAADAQAQYAERHGARASHAAGCARGRQLAAAAESPGRRAAQARYRADRDRLGRGCRPRGPARGNSNRHARPWARHPRLWRQDKKGVDGRDKPGHDEQCYVP